MSILSRFLQRRRRKIEEQRSAGVARAMARGATPEQAKAAGDSAALGTQRAVILGNTLGN